MEFEFHQRRDTTPDGRHVVTIGFFEPAEQRQELGCFGNRVNSIASCWTARDGAHYSHVEMRFSDGTVTSVTQNKPVHFERRLLSNQNYKAFYHINMEGWKEKEMMDMAKQFHTDEIEFNKGGMWWNFLPLLKHIPLQRQGRSVFCSEYIVMLLQKAGYLNGLSPETVSPSDLYIELKQEPDVHWGTNRVLYEATGGKRKPLKMGALTGAKVGSSKYG